MPKAKEEQIPQAAGAQAPDKFESREGRRSGRDSDKPGREEQGLVQRLRDWQDGGAAKGTSSKCRRDTSLAKALLKLKASLFVFCNTFPLRP